MAMTKCVSKRFEALLEIQIPLSLSDTHGEQKETKNTSNLVGSIWHLDPILSQTFDISVAGLSNMFHIMQIWQTFTTYYIRPKTWWVLCPHSFSLLIHKQIKPIRGLLVASSTKKKPQKFQWIWLRSYEHVLMFELVKNSSLFSSCRLPSTVSFARPGLRGLVSDNKYAMSSFQSTFKIKLVEKHFRF